MLVCINNLKNSPFNTDTLQLFNISLTNNNERKAMIERQQTKQRMSRVVKLRINMMPIAQ